MRFLTIIVLLAIVPFARADDAFDQSIAPFLKEHCISCHGPEKREANLRLDGISAMNTTNRNLWTMVHGKVASNEMPP